MADLNKVQLIGRVGNPPEVKTVGQSHVANFSLATNERWTDKQGQKQESTEWHRVVAWGKTAELIGKYVQKGDPIYIEGKLKTEKWEDKDKVTHYTTKVIVSNVQFLGKGESKSEPAATKQSSEPNYASEEDIPF